MGSSSSTPVQPVPAPGHAPIVLTPFKEIPEFQGPDKNKIYQVLEGARSGAEGEGEGAGRMSPVKFKYFTAQGEWGWKWTLFSDERIYYVVKEESYQYYSNIETETETENENENENGDDRKSAGNESSCMMTTYKLRGKSEQIRKYLAKNDPLPPCLLREMGMSNNAYYFVAGSSLAQIPNPKCKFVMQGDGPLKHPALIFYKDPPRYNDHNVTILHMVKSFQHGKVEILCKAKDWGKFQAGNDRKWTVGKKEFQLDICLLDVAKWCVKFERQNPDYSKYNNNCRKFMLELAKLLKIHWDDAIPMEETWYEMNDDKSGICNSTTKN